MSQKVYLYPKWIRLWHAINALVCLLLIISGCSMQYAAPGRMLLPLPVAVKMHNYSGLLLAINYLFFFIGNFITPNGNFYKVKDKPFLTNVIRQTLFYTIGIFRKEEKPFPVTAQRKFNPLQQVAYITAMYVFVPVVILSGIIMLNPTLIEKRVPLVMIDVIHIMAGFLISVFLVIHLYTSTIGFKSNFKAIATGWHEDENNVKP